MAKSSKALESTKALMGALLRQPPKQHDELKAVKKPPAKKKPAKRKKKA